MDGKKFAQEWMGRTVRVTKTHPYRRDPKVEPCTAWRGWVVGYTYRRRGRVETDLDGFRSWRNDGPGYLVVLVCPWPGRKPVDVPLDGLELAAQSNE